MLNGIVIPCYNETKRLNLDAFQKFINQRLEYTLCFVNDGSSDGTLDMLKSFQKGQENRVLVYGMPQNGGKAEAVRSGINYMLDKTSVHNVGFIDADLATGFDDYRSLVLALRNPENPKEMVFGSRKLEEESNIQRTFLRDLASNGVGKFINRIIGLPIKDTQCGAKVFSRDLASRIFNRSFISKWLFDVELFIRAKNFFGKDNVMKSIEEKAIKEWEEIEGSKITLRDSMKFPLQLCKIAMEYNVAPKVEMTNAYLKMTTMSIARSMFL